MSNYPQVLGPHIVSMRDMAHYNVWLGTHFYEVPDPGETWVFSICDEKRTIILKGDGKKAFGELQEVNSLSTIKYYKISETDLRELLTAAHQFWALDGGGVDNWMWCGESCCDYLNQYNADQGTDFDDFEDLAEHEMKGYAIIS